MILSLRTYAPLAYLFCCFRFQNIFEILYVCMCVCYMICAPLGLPFFLPPLQFRVLWLVVKKRTSRRGRGGGLEAWWGNKRWIWVYVPTPQSTFFCVLILSLSLAVSSLLNVKFIWRGDMSQQLKLYIDIYHTHPHLSKFRDRIENSISFIFGFLLLISNHHFFEIMIDGWMNRQARLGWGGGFVVTYFKHSPRR